MQISRSSITVLTEHSCFQETALNCLHYLLGLLQTSQGMLTLTDFHVNPQLMIGTPLQVIKTTNNGNSEIRPLPRRGRPRKH